MELSEKIGARVRKVREYYKLTREELAEKSHISPQFLAQIENGQKSMTTNSLFNVTRALNVTSDYLLFGVEDLNLRKTLACEALSSLSQQDQEITERIVQNILLLLRKTKMESNRETE